MSMLAKRLRKLEQGLAYRGPERGGPTLRQVQDALIERGCLFDIIGDENGNPPPGFKLAHPDDRSPGPFADVTMEQVERAFEKMQADGKI